jgi:hypothetical protein
VVGLVRHCHARVLAPERDGHAVDDQECEHGYDGCSSI